MRNVACAQAAASGTLPPREASVVAVPLAPEATSTLAYDRPVLLVVARPRPPG